MYLQIGKTGDRYEVEVQDVRARANGTLHISGVRPADRGEKIIELSAESAEGYDDAVRQAVERAARTIRNIRSVWVKEFEAVVENDRDSVQGRCEDLVPAR